MKKKMILLCLLIMLVGCTREVIKEVPKIEYKYPVLKIADCDYINLVISSNDTLVEKWNSRDYDDWRNEYDINEFFFNPSRCDLDYGELCLHYANALIVYENCSIYYLDTKILNQNEKENI